jgi:hypothetical protein
MINGKVFDGAAVHKNDLFGSGGSADTRFTQQAADPNPFLGLRLDLKELVQKILPAQVADPVNEPIHRRGLEGGRMIANEGKADIGVTNCVQQELVLNVAHFGVFASKEFPARGKIEKKRPRLNHRTWSFSGGTNGFDPAALYRNFRSLNCPVWSSCHTEPGNARDAWQRLTAKAEGANSSQIMAGSNFACCVAFQAEQGIVSIHPDAIIYDADRSGTSSHDRHFDPGRSGIDAVFDQLFDHRCRPFDHFACRDLTCDFIRQEHYATHL